MHLSQRLLPLVSAWVWEPDPLDRMDGDRAAVRIFGQRRQHWFWTVVHLSQRLLPLVSAWVWEPDPLDRMDGDRAAVRIFGQPENRPHGGSDFPWKFKIFGLTDFL